eukprot:CAMPEP_0196764892 /NCGR_PEP_ID=MMETSP1095-20130614/7124_1 /TAXON_ID=96789 ORGANISM="Chromulina nebulosa, Strain UTEXLB2642" /NCGR_SAMPLE_ID=MMETSP1095 /ASSEMBLY_ACC=CAM_ASM_000446 /LENGTH=554 /DNA_ID=CAMNT_0042121689 /DNA_START=38 /DNA_END=1702 /DNA_ORIENTATION=+
MSLINESVSWKSLEVHSKSIKQQHLRDLLSDQKRNDTLNASHSGIYLDFSRENVTTETIDLLLKLAEDSDFDRKRAAFIGGQHINSTENRAVLHVALRAPRDKVLLVDGVNVIPAVHEVLDKIENFASRVRDGVWRGSTGKPIDTIVSVGIGGSFLGPEFVYEALRTDATASVAAKGRTLRFLANVDPVDVSRALTGLNAETTLVVIVSKTFTTAETMLNARTLKKWLLDQIPNVEASSVLRQHLVAVSSAVSKAVDFGIGAENVFGFWDWVGGRYSVSSAVGVVPLALHYGFDVVRKFLDGLHDIDTHFFESTPRNNIPLLIGLLGVWNASFLGHSSRAILPYSQALTRFAAHIQQVDMESNGKRVSITGETLPYETGEIIFGEAGTNGQHSFYQLLHQGRVVPAEFIGFSKSPAPIALPGEAVSNHDELMSNFFAQPDALAYGKTKDELVAEGVSEQLLPHKEFPGNRPSLSLLFDELTPFTLGQLLAIYEHRVAVQGFIWGINSFDQWGVELGKVLGLRVRNQFISSRNGGDVSGFNSSTSALIKRYLASS